MSGMGDDEARTRTCIHFTASILIKDAGSALYAGLHLTRLAISPARSAAISSTPGISMIEKGQSTYCPGCGNGSSAEIGNDIPIGGSQGRPLRCCPPTNHGLFEERTRGQAGGSGGVTIRIADGSS